jgi:AraC-like DNA-binding protein
MKLDWTSRWYPAPHTLSGVLAGIWSVHAGRNVELAARVLPDGSTCLVFQREGTVLHSADANGRPWAMNSVSGPRGGPLDIHLDPGGRIFIVQLEPAGARRVLGVSMSLLADRFEPLDAVTGPVASRLVDCVLGVGDERACVCAIERWLEDRIRAGADTCLVTEAAVQEIARMAGGVRIGDLAGRVNLSRRQLGRIMKERLGSSPKLFARISRFDKAVQMGRFRPRLSWSRLAFEAGYADQAHMIREFAALGGIRPTDLRSEAAATIW